MKKIMFNDKYGLTQAVLDGRKTQTRRIMDSIASKYRYKNGEEVAIAQKYGDITNTVSPELEQKLTQLPGWSNKMFVKANLMPNRIRITDIRVERLQDISEEDCIAEGIWKAHNVGLEGVTYWYTNLVNSPYRTAKEAYAALIDKISGKGTWESNPWVFVYDFELVK